MNIISYFIITTVLSLLIVSITYYVLNRMNLLHTQFNQKIDNQMKTIITLFSQKTSVHFIIAGIALPKISINYESIQLKGWRLSFTSKGQIARKHNKSITFSAMNDSSGLFYSIDNGPRENLLLNDTPKTIPLKSGSITIHPSPDINSYYGIFLFPEAFGHPIFVSSNQKITSILGRTYHSVHQNDQMHFPNTTNDYVPLEDFSEPDDLIWDDKKSSIENHTLGTIRLHREHLALNINKKTVMIKNINKIPVYILDQHLKLKKELSQSENEQQVDYDDHIVIGHHVLQLKKS